jgi:predicted house-cleaning NTP pyrophosphatase (Maf/HAM1 superfamily)
MQVMTTAGGFTVEDPLVQPYVKRIDGTVDSIEGMPIHAMEALIQSVLG